MRREVGLVLGTDFLVYTLYMLSVTLSKKSTGYGHSHT